MTGREHTRVGSWPRARALVLAVAGSAALVTLALVVAGLPALAQERRGVPPVSADATVEPSTVTVGDRIRLTLRVERDPEVRIVYPDVLSGVAPLDVLGDAALDPITRDGRVFEEHVYVLAAFETGQLGVPQLPFAYVAASGDSGIVWTDSLTIVIESVIPDTLAEEDAGPRDIKPPVDLPRRVWPFVLAAALVAGALAGLHYLRKWWRARSRPAAEKEEPPPPVPRRSAHVVAFERLRALELADPIGRGDTGGFYVAVTEILRLYLRDRFGVDAMDMTTFQLSVELHDARIDEAEVRWTVDYLSHADLAKFARHHPTEERARDDFRGAWDFVERTRFREQEVPEVDGGDEGEDAAGPGAPDRAGLDGGESGRDDG